MSIWRNCNVTNTRANQKNSDSLLVVVRLFLMTGRHAAGSSSLELKYMKKGSYTILTESTSLFTGLPNVHHRFAVCLVMPTEGCRL